MDTHIHTHTVSTNYRAAEKHQCVRVCGGSHWADWASLWGSVLLRGSLHPAPQHHTHSQVSGSLSV